MSVDHRLGRIEKMLAVQEFTLIELLTTALNIAKREHTNHDHDPGASHFCQECRPINRISSAIMYQDELETRRKEQ